MDDVDTFFEPDSATDFVKLSHLNNKSSVLCPETQDITSQYLVLQQLDAHQHMISRAKSTVDTSPPKSFQSYISVTDRQRKKSWHRTQSQSRNSNYNYAVTASSRGAALSSEEDDNVSINASSVNKGIQTGIPFSTFSCITDDKISWYLDALRHGELQSFIGTNGTKNASQHSTKTGSVNRRRVVKGDIMDWHSKSFVQPQKGFSPRIVANTNAKSKVKDMRCYNPPFRRKKKSGSSHSSDTFESYDNEDESCEEESDLQKNSDTSSIEDETQNRPLPSEIDHNPSTNLLNPAFHGYNMKTYDSSHNVPVLSRNEEDKYLNFLSKVTEDILRSGVYSDRAIQQAFEFHMRLYKEEANKEELQSLLNQILAGLKISEDESDDLLSRRAAAFTNFSHPNSPPEKESCDSLQSGEHLRTQSDLNTRLAEDGSLSVQSLEQTLVDVLQNNTSDFQAHDPNES